MRNQQAPSHRNSTNRQRERRANPIAKSTAQTTTEKLYRRASAIVEMGLVKQDGADYLVSTPTTRGYSHSYKVSGGTCNCPLFNEADGCEHSIATEIYAAKQETEDFYNTVEIEPTDTVTVIYDYGFIDGAAEARISAIEAAVKSDAEMLAALSAA